MSTALVPKTTEALTPIVAIRDNAGRAPTMTTVEQIVARLNVILAEDRVGVSKLILNNTKTTDDLVASRLCCTAVDPSTGHHVLTGLGILSALFPLWPSGRSRIAALINEEQNWISMFVIADIEAVPSDRMLVDDPDPARPEFVDFLPPSSEHERGK